MTGKTAEMGMRTMLWTRRSAALLMADVLAMGMVGLTMGCKSSPAQGKDSAESAATELAAETAEASQSAEPADASAPVASVKTVSTGDVEMDYVVFGAGKKAFVILPGLSVHSVMGSADAIAASYADFASEYTVYLFDRAKDIQEGYTVRDMAEDTAAVMGALGIEGADVFGASQGGMIALYLAIDHPELVHKLVLGSTLAKPNDTSKRAIGEWIRLAENHDEAGLLESFADSVYSETTLEAYRDTIISSNAGISDEEFRRFTILAQACETFDCSDELSSIECPVLVLGSEGDRVLTAEGSRQIADALNCEIYLYDDTYGHAVYDEAPDYKQRILDFLAEGE